MVLFDKDPLLVKYQVKEANFALSSVSNVIVGLCPFAALATFFEIIDAQRISTNKTEKKRLSIKERVTALAITLE